MPHTTFQNITKCDFFSKHWKKQTNVSNRDKTNASIVCFLFHESSQNHPTRRQHRCSILNWERLHSLDPFYMFVCEREWVNAAHCDTHELSVSLWVSWMLAGCDDESGQRAPLNLHPHLALLWTDWLDWLQLNNYREVVVLCGGEDGCWFQAQFAFFYHGMNWHLLQDGWILHKFGISSSFVWWWFNGAG